MSITDLDKLMPTQVDYNCWERLLAEVSSLFH